MINCDAVVDNRAGTLWIDLEHIAEVDAVGRRLGELGLPVTALSERAKRSPPPDLNRKPLHYK